MPFKQGYGAILHPNQSGILQWPIRIPKKKLTGKIFNESELQWIVTAIHKQCLKSNLLANTGDDLTNVKIHPESRATMIVATLWSLMVHQCNSTNAIYEGYPYTYA